MMGLCGKKQAREFLEWIQAGAANMKGSSPQRWSAKEKAKAVLPVDGWAERLMKEIGQSIDDKLKRSTFAIYFDENFPNGEYVLKGAGSKNQKLISYLSFSHALDELTIDSSDIDTVEMSTLLTARISVTFRNCRIRHVFLRKGTASAKPTLRLIDTFVETLEAQPSSVDELEVSGGGILNVDVPATYEENPFVGNVSLRKVYFPRRKGEGLRLGVQSYANLRHHLKNLENWQMADVAYTLELAASREDDEWPNRVLSLAYEGLSHFGRSALRPLIWIMVLFSITWVVAFVTGGAVLAHAESSGVYTGWREMLSQGDTAGRASRALVLAFQGLVNPLSIFGLRSLVVARTGVLAAWVFVQSILSIVLVALLVLAVRRRFRVR